MGTSEGGVTQTGTSLSDSRADSAAGPSRVLKSSVAQNGENVSNADRQWMLIKLRVNSEWTPRKQCYVISSIMYNISNINEAWAKLEKYELKY